MGWITRVKKAIHMELREHKSSFVVYQLLRIIVIGVMSYSFINKNYKSFFLCILTLILLILPSFLQVTLKVEFSTVLEITVLLFIFAAQILGEINGFYLKYPNWDTVLHTLCGFLTAAIGVSLVDLLNKSEKLLFELSPFFSSIVGFCFSMTIGVLWEIFEYAMDSMFLVDMQKDSIVQHISSVALDPMEQNVPVIIQNIKSTVIDGELLPLQGYLDIGLYDTMNDLIVNFIGAAVFAFLSYWYIRKRDEKSLVGKIIPRKKAKERDFLK